MKVSLVLFATVLVASVGFISSGGVPQEISDASILQDVRRHAEIFPRVGINAETQRIRFELKAKVAISRGFISTYIDKRQQPIPRGSRCMQFPKLGFSLILGPDNSVVAVPNGVARYDCPIPEQDVQLFRVIDIEVTDAMVQGILRSIPSGYSTYI